MSFSSQNIEIKKFISARVENRQDLLAVEEPLEIRLEFEDSEANWQQKSISITMRTPGHDFDLALGFLFSEGIIRSTSDFDKISYCGPPVKLLGHSNIVKIKLA